MQDTILRVAKTHVRANILPYEDNASGRDPEAEFEKGEKMLNASIKVAEELKKLQGEYKGDAKTAISKVTDETETLLETIGDNKQLAPWVKLIRPLVPKLKATTGEMALGSSEASGDLLRYLLDMQKKAARYLNRRHADPDNEVYEKVHKHLNGPLGKAFKELSKTQQEFEKKAEKLSYTFIDELQYAEILPPREYSPDNTLMEDYNSQHALYLGYARHLILHMETLEETFTEVVHGLKEMKGYLKDMEKNYKARVYK